YFRRQRPSWRSRSAAWLLLRVLAVDARRHVFIRGVALRRCRLHVRRFCLRLRTVLDVFDDVVDLAAAAANGCGVTHGLLLLRSRAMIAARKATRSPSRKGWTVCGDRSCTCTSQNPAT